MSGHIPLRAEQLYALHADLSAKFRRLEQIAYTFLEFLLLEIRGSSVAASQRNPSCKVTGAAGVGANPRASFVLDSESRL
jgi:hypothetical protein